MLSSEAFRQSGNRWVLLVALALIPALHAVLMLGRIHPDEVYQVIEPAFARVHGYGILAWEWDLARGGGIRNWAPPFFFAALLKVCALLGIDNPRAYRTVLELPQFGLHLDAVGGVPLCAPPSRRRPLGAAGRGAGRAERAGRALRRPDDERVVFRRVSGARRRSRGSRVSRRARRQGAAQRRSARRALVGTLRRRSLRQRSHGGGAAALHRRDE